MIQSKALKDIDWENDDVRVILKSLHDRQVLSEKLIIDLIRKVMDSVKAVAAETDSVAAVIEEARKRALDEIFDSVLNSLDSKGVKH